ncbi:hypothetical protein MNBD_GAMMA10-2516 [hydrothermal vent metagenome]|uniref:Uncharacterized protein n=1 Tax=hydrothermal vent metagenome TaxID=652676 RepID=A0A3B0Y1D4_9ZZZZ
MKANPGGQIDLKEIVGRDEIIEQIWDTLEQQSIRMNAERRIGKTTIIKKLSEEPRDGWVPIFQDLEQYHTASEFAIAVFRAVEKYLAIGKKTARRAKKLLETLGGMKVAGVFELPSISTGLPWKDVLCSSIQDLIAERSKQSERPVFLWDEVPYMLESIKNREGETVAMELLDTLRSLRQTHGNNGFRMVFTGSIGLHHVIHSLKRKNYANSPVNDMLVTPVLPLKPAPAKELAIKLIQGECIPTSSLQATACAVANVSDGFPFYIHHIIKAMKTAGLEGTSENVQQIVSQQLRDPNDPWELNHYRDRISTYYGSEFESAVVAILDGVGVSSDAVSINDLLSELKGSGVLEDRNQLIELLRLIEQDHYLARNDNGHYYFQFPLLQRWWKLSRGL